MGAPSKQSSKQDLPSMTMSVIITRGEDLKGTRVLKFLMFATLWEKLYSSELRNLAPENTCPPIDLINGMDIRRHLWHTLFTSPLICVYIYAIETEQLRVRSRAYCHVMIERFKSAPGVTSTRGNDVINMRPYTDLSTNDVNTQKYLSISAKNESFGLLVVLAQEIQ